MSRKKIDCLASASSYRAGRLTTMKYFLKFLSKNSASADILDYLKPVLFVTKLLGISPYIIDKTDVKISWALALYGHIFRIVLNYIPLLFFVSHQYPELLDLDYSLPYSWTLAMNTTIVLIYQHVTQLFINHQCMLSILKRFRRLNEILPLPQTKLRRLIITQVCQLILSFLATTGCFSSLIHIRDLKYLLLDPTEESVLVKTYQVGIGFLWMIQPGLGEILCSTLLHVNREYFGELNKKLELHLQMKQSNLPGQYLMEKKSIEEINLIFSEIFELKSDINTGISLRMLCLISRCFFNAVHLIFLYISMYSYYAVLRTIPCKFSLFVFIGIQITRLYYVCWQCDRILDQIVKSARLVHQLLKSTFDEGIRLALSALSLEVLHNTKPFVAVSMLNLDMTTLHSMIGAITTYLIILTQFSGTKPILQTNSTTLRIF